MSARTSDRDKAPELDAWLPRPAVRVAHQRQSGAEAERLWRSARGVELRDTRVLGRLVRWRIPGLRPETSFDELFHTSPFVVLAEDELSLLSGIVGRIWTLRRDYPQLSDPAEFREWDEAGTVRVLFANWVRSDSGGSVLHSETRVEPFGVQGRVGLGTVRPLIRGFQHLIGTEAMGVALRLAAQQCSPSG